LDGCFAKCLLHARAEDSHHHLLKHTKKSFVVLAQNDIRSIPERLQALLSLLLGCGVALPWQQYPGHVILQVGDATSVLFEGQQTFLLELVHGVLEVLPLLRREVLHVDIHDVRDLRHLDLFGCGPTGRARKCVDAKCAPGAKHTASRTKLASHAQKNHETCQSIFPEN
jgi:hypothetical protein